MSTDDSQPWTRSNVDGGFDAPVEGAHAKIGPTAHYTAYVWHRLGLPHAEHFKTGTGRALYWGFFALGEWATRLSSTLPSMRDYLEYRHRLIDAVLEVEDPDRLVEVGAGLSPRGVAWVLDRGVPAVELDLPAMAAAKRERIAKLPPQTRQRLAGLHSVHDVDALAPEFPGRLADAVSGARRPVVIAEGVLSYFDDARRQQLIAGIAEGLRRAGGGLFVCDTHTRTAQARAGAATTVLKAAIRALTRQRRALSAYDDEAALRSAFTAAGFDATAIVDPADHVAAVPRLRHLTSPALIVTGRVTAG